MASHWIRLNFIADPPLSPVRIASSTSQDDHHDTASKGSGTQSDGKTQSAARGNRQRPWYSLTTAILRKHPILQFFVIRPQN